MRVLDIGCGRGDVALMVARLVGEKGEVLGVDRDARPLAAARERARGFANVTFAEGDLLGSPPNMASSMPPSGGACSCINPSLSMPFVNWHAPFDPAG